MSSHGIKRVLIAAAIAAAMAPCAPAQAAPSEAAQASVTTAHAARSVPDLSGVWMGHSTTFTFDPNNRKFEKPDETPMTPEAAAAFKALRARDAVDHYATDPTLSCAPPGYPRLLLYHFPFEILQLPDRVVMIFEFHHFVREIFTDGRKHPPDLDPTYMGNAIGHWDGDTLVVDTIGFNDKTWLDQVGHPHSDALHLTERIRRVDAKTLEDDITIDDPKTFTHPWSGRQIYDLKPTWTIAEYICEDTVKLQRVPDKSKE
jgi:hypothetical protein